MFEYYFNKENILVLLEMTDIEDGKLFAVPFVINMN